MGKLKQIKFRSATLVEAIVSLVVIVTVTAITVMVFVQVSTSGYQVAQTKAGALIEKYSTSTRKERTYVDEEFTEDDMVIRKQVLEHPYSTKLVALKIAVYNREQTAAASKFFSSLK